MKKDILKNVDEWSDFVLTTSLVGVAIVALYVAFFVKNKWVKAAFLAFEILP